METTPGGHGAPATHSLAVLLRAGAGRCWSPRRSLLGGGSKHSCNVSPEALLTKLKILPAGRAKTLQWPRTIPRACQGVTLELRASKGTAQMAEKHLSGNDETCTAALMAERI